MTTIVDDYSPIVQGDIGAPCLPQFVQGGAPMSIAGLTISLRMVKTDGSSSKNGAGVFTILSAPSGLVSYAYDAADLSDPGEWMLWFVLTNASLKPVHAQPKPLEILPLP